MDYSELISRGWRITWNNKFLWVLGFLAALGSASSNFSSSGSNFSQQASDANLSPEMIAGIGAAAALIGCVALVVGLVFWLLSLVSRGGLISAVARIDDGEKVTLGEAFGAGTGKIGPLVGMSLLLWLPFIVLTILGVVGAIIGIAASAGGAAATGAFESGDPGAIVGALGIFFACFGIMFCLLVPVGLVLQFVYAFAIRGLMLQGLGVMDSIRHGWQVLRANLNEILLLALLFFVIGLLYGIAVAIVILPLSLVLIVPIMGVGMAGGDFGGAEIALLVGGGICLGILGAVLNSILTTWRSATFTLAYREFTRDVGKVEMEPVL